jgi:hypothetical protein
VAAHNFLFILTYFSLFSNLLSYVDYRDHHIILTLICIHVIHSLPSSKSSSCPQTHRANDSGIHITNLFYTICLRWKVCSHSTHFKICKRVKKSSRKIMFNDLRQTQYEWHNVKNTHSLKMIVFANSNDDLFKSVNFVPIQFEFNRKLCSCELACVPIRTKRFVKFAPRGYATPIFQFIKCLRVYAQLKSIL